MSKFNVGDRVKCVYYGSSDEDEEPVGYTGTVTDTTGYFIVVQFEDSTYNPGMNGSIGEWACYPEEIEHV